MKYKSTLIHNPDLNNKEIHLKKIDNKASVCGASFNYTKSLPLVNCPMCIDVVIERRLIEITSLNMAKSLKKSLKDLGKDKEEFFIRA